MLVNWFISGRGIPIHLASQSLPLPKTALLEPTEAVRLYEADVAGHLTLPTLDTPFNSPDEERACFEYFTAIDLGRILADVRNNRGNGFEHALLDFIDTVHNITQ